MIKTAVLLIAFLPLFSYPQENSNEPVAAPAASAPVVPAIPAASAPVEKKIIEPVKPKKNITTSKIIKTDEEDESMTTTESGLEYTKKIQNELEEIKNLGPDRYLQEIDRYRVDIDKYIEHKKRVCNGEFTTTVLGDEKKESSNSVKRKLNTAEKKLCFREMKAFQVTMINNMYIARKRYLEYMHEARMKELALARDKIIEELQNTFSR